MSATQEIPVPADVRPVAAEPAAPRADDALTAAERASAAAEVQADQKKPGHTQARHDAEMERLSRHSMSVHSEALRAAIEAAIPVKQRAFELAQVHEKAGRAFFAASPGPEQEAARQAEMAAEAEWQNMRGQLGVAALAVAHAPFSDLQDVVARAEAFAELVGRAGDNDAPDFDEDRLLMLASYRAAVLEMIERQPSRGDWDDAVAGLRGIEKRIGALEATTNVVALEKAWADRDDAITDLFSMQPPHLDGLLLMLDLVRELRFLGRGTYGSRADAIGDEQVTARTLRDKSDEGLAQGLALIAQHAARLRDLEMPRDWRDAMRDFARIAPGAADAVRNAFDRCMHLPHLKAIQLAGKPDSELPVLMFSGTDGDHWIGPEKAWRGEGVK